MAKQKVLDANGFRKFGMLDCVAYAAGDFGCNMSFALKSTLVIFWTQFMQMGSELYALLLIVVQVWDAMISVSTNAISSYLICGLVLLV